MGGISDERALWLSQHMLRHEPALRAWLRAKQISRDDIDDTIQETYAVLATLPAVAHIANPRAYCFRTAYSLVLQRHRRAQIVRLTAIDSIAHFDPPSEEVGAERRLAAREELQHLASAIAGLPGKCRTAFILRKIEGLSQRETAQRMGISENTVEKHIGKGLRILMLAFGHGGKTRREPSTLDERDSIDARRAPTGKGRDRT